MSSIVIVLPKIEDGKRIRDILAKRGYEIDAVCSTAAAALGEMNNLNGGIVICGYKLPDMFFTDLNECMPSGFQMLLIASSRSLSAVEGTGIMAVTMPLSVYELVNTLEMMLQSAARRRKKERAKPKVRSAEEQHIIDKLVSEFVTADHLHRHIDFLYSHGSMYKVANGNLLFHGCVPLNEDGTFSSMNCLGTWHAGRDYLDFCDHIARRAWRVGDRDALDWMWYLWIGFNSPASGRVVRTFERAYIADKSTWVEPMDPYFTLTKSPSVCDDIMREFGVAPMACSPTGHIINGHTPVKTTKGEQPIRAEGKLLVIDGGFCRAYHPKTGIAGYTLISSSRGCRLKSHQAFTTVAEALTRNVDIESETNRFDEADRRRMVSDTDTGAAIRSQIQDLRQLLDAYRNGAIEERA